MQPGIGSESTLRRRLIWIAIGVAVYAIAKWIAMAIR